MKLQKQIKCSLGIRQKDGKETSTVTKNMRPQKKTGGTSQKLISNTRLWQTFYLFVRHTTQTNTIVLQCVYL